MMELRKPKGHKMWFALYRLYLAAFPSAERKPWSMIRKMYRTGKTDIWCLMEAGHFVGLAITINGADTILLDYFAIERKRRGQGVGTAALKAVLSRYADKGLFLEIESTLESAPDQAQRLRRKKFYLSCGLQEMHTQATLFGVKMELLGSGCQLDYDGYRAFYRENYNAWAADHITPAE